jgi:chaperonin GroEL
MPDKHLLFGGAAREKVYRGATVLADAVRVTLGPRSRCVLIGRRWGRPIVCNDGVTIAKEVELKDADENLGAQLIREAAERTGDAVGDGTSTATVLAHAMFTEGLKNVAAGASAAELKRGMDRGTKAAVDALKAMSRPVESRKERSQVATVSAHNDPAMGNLVADAMEKVGKEGVVSVEESQTTDTSLEVVEGMQFDRGYLSPYFITDATKMEAVLDEPLILLYEKRISAAAGIVPLLEQVVQAHRSLLIIAEDVDAEALAVLVVNKIRGTIACAATKAPGYGDRRKAMMEDLALLTGGRFIAEELGVKLEGAKVEDLGSARRVVLTSEHTTVIGGAGRKEAIAGRCAEIRQQIQKTTSDYDREKLEERLAKLSGGVALIRIGAPSEAEMKSRKEAVEDAISATKAAMAEGVVPGGGLALLRVIDVVAKEEAKCEGDERTGIKIIKRALEAPARQIAENSGADAGVAVGKMRDGTGNVGFDAARGEFVDLCKAGIIDPTKVVRVALENAASVAGTLLLTEATLTELPEPRHEAAAGAGALAEV